MQARSFTLAALAATVVIGLTLPAFASHHDDHDRGRRDEHRDWHGGYAPPPVFVAPPAYGYYAPPPVYSNGPPGVSIGINIP